MPQSSIDSSAANAVFLDHEAPSVGRKSPSKRLRTDEHVTAGSAIGKSASHSPSPHTVPVSTDSSTAGMSSSASRTPPASSSYAAAVGSLGTSSWMCSQAAKLRGLQPSVRPCPRCKWPDVARCQCVVYEYPFPRSLL
ncbi:hypothetical protein EON64_12175 [archaeon]|nr:MAG: hypothetical protein EON64_12175 [archaeon]